MKIDTLKDLKKLVELCRKVGIDAMEIGDIKFNLSPIALPKAKASTGYWATPEAEIKIPQYSPVASNITADIIKTDELTADELLFYSATNQDVTSGQ